LTGIPTSDQIIYRNLMAHPSESMLEDYVMRRLSSYDAEQVKEHLGVCSYCREGLQAEIDFMAAMRAAGIRRTEWNRGIARAKGY
jgi:hypothetical protein